MEAIKKMRRGYVLLRGIIIGFVQSIIIMAGVCHILLKKDILRLFHPVVA